MNELQRTVLHKHSQDIVKDMIVTENILGAMFQRNIFDSEMIEIIKSGRTHSEQVYKMLEFLPKRGPDAFDNFYEILLEDYSWIAKLLKESLETESERILATQNKKEDSPPDTKAHKTNAFESVEVKDQIFSVCRLILLKLQRSPVKKLLNRAKALTNGAEGSVTNGK